MKTTRAFLRAGALALGLLAAGRAPAQTASVVTLTDASGAPTSIATWLYPDGSLSPRGLIVSPLTGQPYNSINGLPVSPAATAGYGTPRSVKLVVAGTVYPAMPAAASGTPRKAAFCQASLFNTGVIGLSVGGTPSTPPSLNNDIELAAGNLYDLNQHGIVEQGAVQVVSTAANDVVLCKDFQ